MNLNRKSMNDSQKNILIFSEKGFLSAPRVIREINCLQADFNLFLSGTDSNPGLSRYYNMYTFLSFGDKLRNRLNHFLKRKAIPKFSNLPRFISENHIELIILHEAKFLPLATRLKERYAVKVIFNAHEYHPLEFEDQPGWLETEGKHYAKLYRNYLKKLDLLVNVCESIRLKCLTEFDTDSIVIPNASPLKDLPVKSHRSSTIRIIHHGANLPSRKVENMIQIASGLGNEYSLDLMLTTVKGCESYDEMIRKKIADTPNVTWKKPVDIHQICSEINDYDIGLFYLEPTNFNYRFALPNKLFEFIQARLAIAISPSPEMKNLVEKYDLGVYSEDFSIDSMVEKISSLSLDEIQRFKQNSDRTARIENTQKYDAIYLSKVLSLVNN
jgi:hypothetical protein